MFASLAAKPIAKRQWPKIQSGFKASSADAKVHAPRILFSMKGGLRIMHRFIDGPYCIDKYGADLLDVAFIAAAIIVTDKDCVF